MPASPVAGLARGEQQGKAQGFELGQSKGLELGRELGHYRGRTEALMALYALHPDRCTDRCADVLAARRPRAPSDARPLTCCTTRACHRCRMRRTLTAVQSRIADIRLDPSDEACFESLEEVRAKMRMVDSWLKGSRTRAEAQQSSGTTELSF